MTPDDIPRELDRIEESYLGDRLRLTLLQALGRRGPRDHFLAAAVASLLSLDALGCDLGVVADRLAADFAVELRRQETAHA